MKKLRFKNRNGILYFGIGDKLISSKLKFTRVNKNIIIGKFRDGKLNEELGIGINEGIPMISDLLDDVMQSKIAFIKHKTFLAYKATLKHSILPYFEDTPVSSVKPIAIKKWHDVLIAKGLKRQSISTARVLLKEAFNLAIMSEYMETNPVIMVQLPRMKRTKKKQKPFTLDEIDLILDNCPNKQVKNFLGISFFTGMRSGEVLALEWNDIDFETDTISITKTIAQGTINTPKTYSSYRDIEMLPSARRFFKSQQLQTGIKNSYLFFNTKGNYYGSTLALYKNYKSILTKLNLEHRTLHNTRHTFASMMLNNGIDPMWVSNTLGHENLDITLKVYAHFMPKKEKMIIDFLDKRYKNGTDNH
ncbi:tyrosine-type recombinase/integrase [Sulfurimonas sp.]|uniref:tyrosine-type recombinase/integrase n=1 Tax=Sulfurimonas sp. TaxID=2022749 RepID=UPI003569EEF5